MLEKSILVCYLNSDNIMISDIEQNINLTNDFLKNLFKKEIDNNELTILVIPVQNQPTKVELLNSKYPYWKELKKQLPELMIDLNNNLIDKNRNKNE